MKRKSFIFAMLGVILLMNSGCTVDFFPALRRDPEVGRIRNLDREWAMKVWVDRNAADEEDYFLYPRGFFGEESEAESEVIARAERGDHFLEVKAYCRIRGEWRLAAKGRIEFCVDSRMNGEFGWTVDIYGWQLTPLY